MAAKRRTGSHPDRFIVVRGGAYSYRRRVPADVAHLDKRAPEVRVSLRTSDLAMARAIRDIHERADNELWAALIMGDDDPWARFEVAQRLARAAGFAYKPARALISGDVADVIDRIEALSANPVQKLVVDAVLGLVDTPTVTISKAFEIYVEKIAAHEIAGKSPAQRKLWKAGKQRSVDHFIEVAGDLDIRAITREDAIKYHEHWMGCIAPKEGAPTHTPDIGNRRLGDLKVLHEAYFTYAGEKDRANPFEKLRFNRKNGGSAKRRKRPSFSLNWITDVLLKPGALAGMNAEARGIFLMVASTGARPSEIANLRTDRIALAHAVPHIRIEPDEDPEDRREIKTGSSIRAIPLVGLALEVMRKFPAGFPRYVDKGNSLSAALNKYLDENDLLESDRHTVYSLRHSFEDRMKDAKVDSELRRILMGHSIDRPEYGEGGSLKLRQEAMAAVALPFDAAIV